MQAITTDFFLSAYLCLKGLKIKELQDTAGKDRKLFVFHDSEQFNELKQQFYWNQANVDPLAYKQELRKLKGLVMSN